MPARARAHTHTIHYKAAQMGVAGQPTCADKNGLDIGVVHWCQLIPTKEEFISKQSTVNGAQWLTHTQTQHPLEARQRSENIHTHKSNPGRC